MVMMKMLFREGLSPYESDGRFSQLAPVGMFEEKNTRTNLPAQIDLYQTGGDEYHFFSLPKEEVLLTRPFT